jgi:hypothetical protein
MQPIYRNILASIITSLSICSIIEASDVFIVTNARNTALANASASLLDNSAIGGNPAGIARFPSLSFELNCWNLFQIKELNSVSAGTVLPVSFGNFGTSVSYFGTTRYNNQKYAFGYGRFLGDKITAGVSCDYFVSKLPSKYESARVLTGEIGLLAQPFDKLSLGIHIFNISNSPYKNYLQEDLPVLYRIGASWKDTNFLICSQLQMEKSGNSQVSIGFEVKLIETLFVRAGISNNQQTNYSFGLGYIHNSLSCDVAFSHHPILGLSSFITVRYSFKSKIK